MAFYDSALLAANKAMNRIPALAKQARSYSMPLANQAKSIASGIARTPIRGNLIKGGLAGAGASMGYDALTNDRSDFRSIAKSGLTGGVLGMGAGAAFAYGRAAYGMGKAGGFNTMAGSIGGMMAPLGQKAKAYGRFARMKYGAAVRGARQRVGNSAAMGTSYI